MLTIMNTNRYPVPVTFTRGGQSESMTLPAGGRLEVDTYESAASGISVIHDPQAAPTAPRPAVMTAAERAAQIQLRERRTRIQQQKNASESSENPPTAAVTQSNETAPAGSDPVPEPIHIPASAPTDPGSQPVNVVTPGSAPSPAEASDAGTPASNTP